MKKFFSVAGIAAFALFPNLLLAQEEATPEPLTAPVSVPESVPPIEEAPAPLETSAPVQESTSTQQTIPSDALEATENPQEQDTLEEAIEVIDDSTAEMEAETASTTEEVIEVIEEATTTPVAELPAEILEPEKEYSFEISGAAIAADASPEWSEPLLEAAPEGEEITEVPALDTDTPHILTVAGECDTPYYVILIYQNQEDYNANPSSYIFNRAFPCENGRYSYDVKELPFSLESGIFYLMVAGQGDKGPWKPITALTPIGVTVKTIIPSATSTHNESAQ
ncbi:hypothetical protein KW784_01045 [Candidatus Parcubacteria bacterium]|nr:hypothetical protein [Candidatus Parcubacteria bacterium]